MKFVHSIHTITLAPNLMKYVLIGGEERKDDGWNEPAHETHQNYCLCSKRRTPILFFSRRVGRNLGTFSLFSPWLAPRSSASLPCWSPCRVCMLISFGFYIIVFIQFFLPDELRSVFDLDILNLLLWPPNPLYSLVSASKCDLQNIAID